MLLGRYKISKEEILYFILFVIYRALLDYVYIHEVHPAFDYVGMHLDWNWGMYILSWGVYIGGFHLFYLNLRKNNFLGLCVYMLGILSFVPTTSLLGLFGVEMKFLILMTIYWFLLFTFIFYIRPMRIKCLRLVQGKYTELFWLICSSLIVIYISGKYTGFRLHFDLIDVYDIRFEANTFNLPTILIYIHNAINTLLPVLLILQLSARKYKTALFIVCVIFLNFSIAGHKSVIFMLFLALLAYYFFTWQKKIFLLVGMITIIIISILEPLFIGTAIFFSVFVNRLLYIPVQLHIAYYDFFQSNELLLYREGPLRWFGLETPYDMPIAYLIGGHVTGDYKVMANNGLFTDAYANMGILGILFLPLVICFLLNVLNAFAKNLNSAIQFVIAYKCISILVSTSFTTALLNNGLLLIMLFLYTLSYNKNSYYIRN